MTDPDDATQYDDPGAAHVRVSEALKQLRIVREDDTEFGTPGRRAINRAVEATEIALAHFPEPDDE